MKKEMMKAITVILTAAMLMGCAANPPENTAAGTAASDAASVASSAAETANAADAAAGTSDLPAEDAAGAASDTAGQEAAVQDGMTEQTIPLYIGEIGNKKDLSVYFFNESNVPYVTIDFATNALDEMLDHDHEYEISQDGDTVTVTRKGTPFTAVFDFAEDTISFLDYDAFMRIEGEALVSFGGMTGEFGYLYQPIAELTNDRYGKEMCFDLKPYEIDLVKKDDGYYVPLHTLSDLFLSYYNAYELYNGESVIVAAGLDEKLTDLYYSSAPERTEDFATFDYHELCFMLDHMYGLKEIHGIDNFDEYFYEIGVKKRLMGTDQSEADAALYEFISCYLDDLHSGFMAESCGSDPGKIAELAEGIYGPWKIKFNGWIDEFEAERNKAYPDGYLPYEEVGNTAYITFDSFVAPREDIDYNSEPKEEELGDTIRLMQYSYDRIMREGSPVENVVMDLSMNIGGDINAACYVIGTYLGVGSINVKNTMPGATTTAQFHIDSTRDGRFDEKDTLGDKDLNLYCLISPVSFSCGNLVPNEFKADPHVTLIGKTSGGGSCSYMPMATAGGTRFKISGYRRMSTFKNGSFYDIDRGAEPDIYIDRISDYYDRKTLNKIISGK